MAFKSKGAALKIELRFGELEEHLNCEVIVGFFNRSRKARISLLLTFLSFLFRFYFFG